MQRRVPPRTGRSSTRSRVPAVIEFWSYALRDPALKAGFTERWDTLRAGVARLIEAQSREAGTVLPVSPERFARW